MAQFRVVGCFDVNRYRRAVAPALGGAARISCRVLSVLLPLLMSVACSVQRTRVAPPAQPPGPRVALYVVRRAGHADVGFAMTDLEPPLSSLRAAFPGAHYLLFGFGDRAYWLAGGRGLALLEALWPGPGIVLATSLTQAPQAERGADNVVRLEVTVEQARRLQRFVWSSLTVRDGAPVPVQVGPDAGSWFYATPQRYSLLHTCNTWAAQALKEAGLPIRSAGVELVGQLWRQLRRLQREQSSAGQQGASAARRRQGVIAG